MPAQTFPLFYQTPAPPKVPVVFALFFFAASICTQTPAQDHTGRFLVLASTIPASKELQDGLLWEIGNKAVPACNAERKAWERS